METVNIHQAKTNLSRLLSRVELGEEIVISNRGIPIAKLVPFRTSLDRRSSLGQDRGMFTVPDDFNAPLPEDILVAFEGGAE
ncbi:MULTISPECIES: type II toxin-antitoxin system Phd/YefM family antitoxin [Microcystis]|jgi:prevent-host-death family protein|uniref:Antitoxin n=6 Tax=Microcystis TaxID=1125 RepID=A0A841UHW8_MICAE|nr:MULTISPECIES: type II toxin-antitoxin system Phd/YefM family antitoxin [Microcystis]MCA2541415.1 type II toxin-antitoxin system Phd/YefM family antitoxin [Microcystis sp. M54BS1]MCA2594828.1 type II toxin-antitoxin system Phd/YefM family antitoxin [Microcystis sp. M38BS1]MCA2609623.1 type II toxin-antitoxin system Phd/YefM family antitoxin [Microcystis sp. M27BS1]MCA2816217.1 type II toxin-antitoxin system Phd/YefM family antitoxin [Microcystis sp. M085S1]MCA2856922.1 type II toxin-antitoxi